MKIALGTAQLGFDYGISNTNGQTKSEEANQILSIAQGYKIDFIDTASAYGESEKIIGEYSKKNTFNYHIVTKISLQSCLDLSVKDALSLSLKRLNTKSVYSVMIHDSDKLLTCSRNDITSIKQQFEQLKKLGLCKKIGISVYTPEQLEQILTLIDIDIVQIPLNIFDQRFISNNVLSVLHQRNIEIHARSIFLQGLLLMEHQKHPHYFNQYQAKFKQFNHFCQQHALSKIEACLSFAKAQEQIDKFVIGVSSAEELIQIVELYKALPTSSASKFSALSSSKLPLINPALWVL
jgi:aryl-alcohol dehydrogenase-like predicted oxidoreductase